LRRKVQVERLRLTLGDTDEIVQSAKSKVTGHPTVLTEAQEEEFVLRILTLAGRRLGCTSEITRKAVHRYVIINQIKHPWKHKGLAGEDCFSCFMKIHPNLSLRKSEGFSREVVSDFSTVEIRYFDD